MLAAQESTFTLLDSILYYTDDHHGHHKRVVAASHLWDQHSLEHNGTNILLQSCVYITLDNKWKTIISIVWLGLQVPNRSRIYTTWECHSPGMKVHRVHVKSCLEEFMASYYWYGNKRKKSGMLPKSVEKCPGWHKNCDRESVEDRTQPHENGRDNTFVEKPEDDLERRKSITRPLLELTL